MLKHRLIILQKTIDSLLHAQGVILRRGQGGSFEMGEGGYFAVGTRGQLAWVFQYGISTLRNADSIDIHASSFKGDRLFAIRVKTQQIATRSWPLNLKAEKLESPRLFYVFVSFKGLLERPDYFIVPSFVVAERIRTSHASWLSIPGKSGQKHNDTSIRKFEDKTDEFKEKWELLK